MVNKLTFRQLALAVFIAVAVANVCWGAQTPAPAQKLHSATGYGAKGNGIVDDTAAIQRALNAGGETYLPSGTYMLSRTLVIPSSAKLIGDGKATVLKWRRAAVGISIGHAQTVSLGEMTLTGSSRVLVDIADSTDVHLDHIWFRSTGPRTSRPFTAALSLSGSSDVWVSNSDFTDNADFDLVANYSSPGPTDRLHVQNNRIHGSRADISIGLFDTSNSVIDGNTIDQNNQTAGKSNDGYGILVYCKGSSPKPPTGNQITNNLVENTAGSGIYVQGASNTTIAHNHIHNSVREQNGQSLPAAAIAVNAGYKVSLFAEHISVLDNEIDGSGKAGIELSSTKNATVRGNQIKDTSGQAVRLRFNNDQSVVEDNNSH